ncbi:MAG: IS256 family transposase [Acidobacteriales bacterium]|nr:IS256 family transposase [Terriglobales bacterium]
MNDNQDTPKPTLPHLPDADTILEELAKAKSIDDLTGKDGVFARLFGKTLSAMLEGEMSAHLGYEPYEAKGRNSGNSRNGKRERHLKTSSGEVAVRVPRDRNGSFEPQVLRKYETSSSELEDKIIAMYARGMTVRDIQSALQEMYGIQTSAETISKITDKVLPLVEAWQNRALATHWAIWWLDAIHVKLKREHKIVNTAVYLVMGIDLEGKKDVLGHWVGDGAEGSSFWLSVITELKNRGVQDVFIACVDGLSGFEDALRAVFARTEVQRCLVHQVRYSLKYVTQKDRKAFTADLKPIYTSPTREAAETALLHLSERWSAKYALAVRSWEANWEGLATMFAYTPEIRRLIYTTNPIEGYNRQLRKATKTKGAFPTVEAVRKSFWLAHQNIAANWDRPIYNWELILNQLAIRFEARMPL